MSYNVLIVDDSAVVRKMVRRAIDMSGIDVGECHEAANGIEALKLLADRWVDIVLLDLNMPEMGGAELVERMSEDNLLVSIPVVIVSANQNAERIDDLKRKGIRAYLKKPFRPESFSSVVREVLGGATEAADGA